MDPQPKPPISVALYCCPFRPGLRMKSLRDTILEKIRRSVTESAPDDRFGGTLGQQGRFTRPRFAESGQEVQMRALLRNGWDSSEADCPCR
ncbi:hypothetical protein EDC27_1346 [Desulfosoma caldarium]|uniref:Uncharacterized protein n=1 Tax=Desulfosoma caldarium TaxID=610254 RepID=A0A3N1UQD7_9BACT|nr:hypothetical protein EDC27_1346 [Desulfosoma caldarium]